MSEQITIPKYILDDIKTMINFTINDIENTSAINDIVKGWKDINEQLENQIK